VCYVKTFCSFFICGTSSILSQPGVKYFLSEKLCQDPLEKLFGCLSQRGKANDNPMLNEVFKGTQALRVIGDINVKAIVGNCRGKKKCRPTCCRKFSITKEKKN